MTMANIDTIFSFVLVMLLLSLIITTLVQMMVGVLGLRGRTLLWGIRKILEQCPTLINGQPKEIAKKVLDHPSIRSGFRKATTVGSEELLAILKNLNALKDEGLNKQAIAEYLSHAQQLQLEFSRVFPGDAKKMEAVFDLFKEKVSKSHMEISTWFDTVMTRTTDRFVMQTRVFTIGFAVVLSIWFHIDSIRLIQDLSTDPELRASLIQMADGALAKAEGIVGGDTFAVIALNEIRDKLPNAEVKIPSAIRTESEGRAWLEVTFKGAQNLENLLEAFSQQFQVVSKRKLQEFANNANELKTELEESRLSFLTIKQLSLNPASHLKGWLEWVGVLISAALLSLGAPFWFNALRNLSRLRPVLAGKVDPSKEVKN